MTVKTDTGPIRVAIVAFPVGMLSCVLSMQDSLLLANYCAYRLNTGHAGFDPKVVSAEPDDVGSFTGLRLHSVDPLPAPDSVDLVLIPAGPPPVVDAPSLQAWLTRNENLIRWVAAAHAAGAQIASTCTGSMILAAAGLLDGIPATTHWAMEWVAHQSFPAVHWRVDESIVMQKQVITAGGGSTYTALIMHLTKQYLGANVAMETSRMLLSDPHVERQAAFRQDSQQAGADNPRIEHFKQFLANNFRRTLSLDDMAEAVSLTQRTLNRTCQRELGMTPMQYLQRVRIEAVMRALQLTPTPASQIIWDIGYEDVSSFQRLFKRHTGVTMTEYRRRFGVKVYSYDTPEQALFEA